MSDIKWIKVAVDMFEDSKIEFIRSLPEGDAIIVTWIQMLSIAGKSNMGGYLMVADGIPYTEQLLSNKLRRQPVLLQFALDTLSKLKMIDIEDGPFHITKWEKHQNVEGMEKVRIQTNNRVKKHRDKEKNKLETLQSNANVTLQVTHGNATELELDLDIKPIPDSNECGEMFKTFWKAYPNKHGKADAERKWKIYYRDKKLNFSEVMDGLEKYITFCTEKDRPLKDGSTFVNSRAWEDDWTIKPFTNFRNTTSQLPEYTPDETRNEIYERALEQRKNRNGSRGTAWDADSAS
jgi:predicted phage replisome organizer